MIRIEIRGIRKDIGYRRESLIMINMASDIDLERVHTARGKLITYNIIGTNEYIDIWTDRILETKQDEMVWVYSYKKTSNKHNRFSRYNREVPSVATVTDDELCIDLYDTIRNKIVYMYIDLNTLEAYMYDRVLEETGGVEI